MITADASVPLSNSILAISYFGDVVFAFRKCWGAHEPVGLTAHRSIPIRRPRSALGRRANDVVDDARSRHHPAMGCHRVIVANKSPRGSSK